MLKELGKGCNVWYCMGYVFVFNCVELVVLYDCDIVMYNKDLLVKLIYFVVNLIFNYEFCKGYYVCVVNGKINGCVFCLLVILLFCVFKCIMGDNEYLEFMDSFRYLLVGEFFFCWDVLNDICIFSDWGLEIGVFFEMYRNYLYNCLC